MLFGITAALLVTGLCLIVFRPHEVANIVGGLSVHAKNATHGVEPVAPLETASIPEPRKPEPATGLSDIDEALHTQFLYVP